MSQSAFGACPEDVLLFLRSLDPLEDAPGDEVDRHVADCPRCRSRLEALRVEANTMRAEGATGHELVRKERNIDSSPRKSSQES